MDELFSSNFLMKIFTWMKNEKLNVGKVGLEPNLCPRFEKKKLKIKNKKGGPNWNP